MQSNCQVSKSVQTKTKDLVSYYESATDHADHAHASPMPATARPVGGMWDLGSGESNHIHGEVTRDEDTKCESRLASPLRSSSTTTGPDARTCRFLRPGLRVWEVVTPTQ